MVRVLMCGPVFSSGGVATHTKYISKHLLCNGVNLILYHFDSSSVNLDFINSSLKIYRRTFGLFIFAFFNRKKYDCIHTQTSGGISSFVSAVTGSIVSKLLQKKLVVTFHNSAKIESLVTKYYYLFTYVLKNTEIMILVSNSQKDTLSKYYPIYSSKMSVIPNGYDSSLFYPQNIGICRQKLGLSIEKKIIVSVGNLLEVKGHKYLIKGMESVIKHRKDIQCYIVGSGILEGKLREQVILAKLQDYIKFVGGKSHDEIPLWINACDVFVLPSLNEGNPTVMFESLGCGKPFIGTKVGGVPEIVSSEDYGLLVEPGDSQNLAEKIGIALGKEWDSVKIIEYSSQFTWKEISNQIVDVYNMVYQKD